MKAVGSGILLAVVLFAIPCRLAAAQATGAVEIDFVEDKTETPLTCRVKILDTRGRALRARGAAFHSGWNLVEPPLRFKGRPGDYTYQVFHGPQFSSGSGGFTLDKKSNGYDILRLPRHANLQEEGWLGGDLMSHLPAAQTLRWLDAEDLFMAVQVSQRWVATPPDKLIRQDDSTSWVEQFSYQDNRPGSGLTLHHWMPPAEVPKDLPSSRLLVMAKRDPPEEEALPVHAEIGRLWARDTPIWLASGLIDSIQILSDHLTIDGTGTSHFQPIVDPDPGRFRGVRGPGRLVEYLYWQVLETGLRIPPSAGSGFGRTPSPLGYNRVYAFVGSPTRLAWWQALEAGRTFVTSGPLLRTRVNGAPPGAVFEAATGSVDLDIGLTLTVSDPVEYLDVIFNGETLYQARLDEYARQGGKIPPLSVEESGWLVVRVITERAHTYRIATTAPYYVEIGGTRRVSRSAVEFFQQWLEESASQLETSAQATSSDPYLSAARRFWQARLEQATAP